jgi:tetratricopeptide (TPR) repeat protein
MLMSLSVFALALAAAPLAPVPSSALGKNEPELAVQSLATGHADQALSTLEEASAADPQDAALLINLGIAYAQMGDDQRAGAAFEQALATDEMIELETADDTTTDSRRLARKELEMLERGAFRAEAVRPAQLTRRD